MMETLSTMTLLTYWISQTGNPVKMGILITAASLTLFTTITFSMGTSWFPLIYLMLFLGGILVMFLILSSLLPNEKASKMKMILVTPIVVVTTTTFIHEQLAEKTFQTKEMKCFATTKSNIMLVAAMIALYFFGFLKILSEKSFSMRSYECYKL